MVSMQDPHELQNADKLFLERSIGKQLKTFRKQSGLTVTQLAEAAHLSIAMVSKMENGQTSPSLTSLQNIAKALNIPITALFRQFEQYPSVSHVRQGKGLHIERRGTRSGHNYQLLGHGVAGPLSVEPYLITLTHESETFSLFQHRGIEYIYMLGGELDYRHGSKVYNLKPGDSLFFDATVTHGPENLISLPATFLSMNSYIN